jgi:hypothetical protein
MWCMQPELRNETPRFGARATARDPPAVLGQRKRCHPDGGSLIQRAAGGGLRERRRGGAPRSSVGVRLPVRGPVRRREGRSASRDRHIRCGAHQPCRRSASTRDASSGREWRRWHLRRGTGAPASHRQPRVSGVVRAGEDRPRRPSTPLSRNRTPSHQARRPGRTRDGLRDIRPPLTPLLRPVRAVPLGGGSRGAAQSARPSRA